MCPYHLTLLIGILLIGNSVEKYVDKQQKRIYEAEVNKESNLAEDKGLLEPSVVKATRWVLRRI